MYWNLLYPLELATLLYYCTSFEMLAMPNMKKDAGENGIGATKVGQSYKTGMNDIHTYTQTNKIHTYVHKLHEYVCGCIQSKQPTAANQCGNHITLHECTYYVCTTYDAFLSIKFNVTFYWHNVFVCEKVNMHWMAICSSEYHSRICYRWWRSTTSISLRVSSFLHYLMWLYFWYW